MERVALFWSGGKDSCLALHKLMEDGCEISYLVVTISQELERVSMHGVRKELLEQQAKALNIPAKYMPMPAGADNAAYEKALFKVLDELKAEGMDKVAFGDIFLEDLKQYREKLMDRAGVTPVFPHLGREYKSAVSGIH